MKLHIESALMQAMRNLGENKIIQNDLTVPIQLERPKSAEHGDFSSNIAFLLAKPCKKPPRELAQQIINALPKLPMIAKVELAGAGFINFFLKNGAFNKIVADILTTQERYGHSAQGKKQKILIEFVSSNPTGPLHVGHGRGAAFGATLASLLKVAGYKVTTEYYVNDAGRQMDILAVSVWLRYLACAGEEVRFPDNAYQGDYVKDIAKILWENDKKSNIVSYIAPFDNFALNLPLDESQGGDKELYIDAVINKAKECLGNAGFRVFHQAALDNVLADIREDLQEFGVSFDIWFSEASLFSAGAIEKGIAALTAKGHTYTKDGALWFSATKFGDEKDRVLIRDNKQTTYFASDVAYHWDKYRRGFDRVIDVFGADHHGYVSRVKAAVHALGHDSSALDVILVQFATLFRKEERVQMSTRSGSFVTLRELRQEVGNDAARFFYVLRKPEQHMEFDLALAKSQSHDNPVYYIQYAYARIASVKRQLIARGFNLDNKQGLEALDLLTLSQEEELLAILSRYPEVIEVAARQCEPHLVAYYLKDLATSLHSYYNAVTLICDDEKLRNARLCLLQAVAIVIHNGATLLGVSTPESM